MFSQNAELFISKQDEFSHEMKDLEQYGNVLNEKLRKREITYPEAQNLLNCRYNTIKELSNSLNSIKAELKNEATNDEDRSILRNLQQAQEHLQASLPLIKDTCDTRFKTTMRKSFLSSLFGVISGSIPYNDLESLTSEVAKNKM